MKPFAYSDLQYLAVELPEEIRFYQHSGDFSGEIKAIHKWLARTDIAPAMIKRLELELILAAGMEKDYETTFDEMLALLQKKYPACRAEHLQELIDSGYVDFILWNGEIRFQDDAYANILKTRTDYLKKVQDPTFEPELGDSRSENIALLKKNGTRAFRFHVHQWIKPAPEAERPGEHIRAWLPIPAETPEQTDIRILSTSGQNPYISNAQHRTICFDTVYASGQQFSVDSSFVNRAFYKELNPALVSDDQPDFYTQEDYPHIRFTPYIRELADWLKGKETNPLLIAKRFYDYITKNVRYSYMRDYLLIENITEFCARNLRGDCGVQALLFITLCRYAGIPAKWQSGNYITPDSIGSHDWAQFYIAPFGWLFCDPSFGGGGYRRGDEPYREFYFGNIDPYRFVANTDFQKPFDPPSRYIRNDPYDNQSGEMEYDDGSLAYNEIYCGRKVVESEELS